MTAAIGAGLYFLERRSGKDFLVIRVNNDYVNQLRASIAAVTQINGQEVILWVAKLAGTVKSLMKREVSKQVGSKISC